MTSTAHPVFKAQKQQVEFEHNLCGGSLFSPDNNIALTQYAQSMLLLSYRMNSDMRNDHPHFLATAFVLTLSVATQLDVNLADDLGGTRRENLKGLADEFAMRANPDLDIGSYCKLRMEETSANITLLTLADERPFLAQIAGGVTDEYLRGRAFGNKRALSKAVLSEFSRQLLTAFGVVQRKAYIKPGINLDRCVEQERDRIRKAVSCFPRLAA